MIVEIQGNPQGADDAEAEYIEVRNVSGRALDLSGVVLAHVETSGGMPVVSTSTHTLTGSIPLADGGTLLLTRSSGGYFGGASPTATYGGFVFANGGSESNRVRLYVPGWDGTEPPDASDLIDEVITPAGTFDNALRGRTWQLDPSEVAAPTAATNDDAADWCTTAESVPRAYWGSNWGTPGAPNDCD